MSSIDPLWLHHAFDSPRAFGPPLGSAVLRAEPEDFVVEEQLGFEPAGTGQHVLLKVRKRDANTQWVARELAKLCRCRPADVGYAGLKDRRAIVTQWFSVPQFSSKHSPPSSTADWWQTVRAAEFDVLEAHAHTRKLPRGALAGNSFNIRLREVSASDEQLAARIALLERRGVPNYFGPQRFGREGSNLVPINSGLRGLRPPQRGFVLSAARSLIFNAVLAERVSDGYWERLQAGDMANLDGRGSVFAVDRIDATLIERCSRLDIHPTGPMWGRGLPTSKGEVLELERKVAAQLTMAAELASEAGMEQERRSSRMSVRNLSWAREASDTVILHFSLTRGSFATTVLREIFDVAPVGGGTDGEG